MDKMKNAYQRAMERVEQLGNASEEETIRLTWMPKGQTAAAQYLNGQEELQSSIDSCPTEMLPHFLEGITKVLLQNITLPKSQDDHRRGELAVKGMSVTKKDTKALEGITSKITYILSTYMMYKNEKMNEMYEETKTKFQSRVQETLIQQGKIAPGTPVPINVEAMPEFRQEWNNVLLQFDDQYSEPLNLQKAKLEKIS